MSRARLLLLLVMGCLVGAFFALDLDAYLSLSRLQAHQEQASAWVQAHFGQAALLFTLLYVATTALSLPGASLLTLGGSALFGVGWGLLLVSFASSLGATLAFLSARFLLRDWVSRRFGDKLATFEAGMAKDGAFYLLSLRLIPLFPFFLVNLLMGLTPIRVSTYYWVSQLGMLPGTFVYVLAGSELATLTSTGNILSPGLVAALTLLGLMPWLMRGLQRRLALRRLHAPYRKPARFDYNLLVIGAGAGGLVTSYIAAAVKARVALIEQHKMGGDCLNTGCVPSKALIRSARFAFEQRKAGELGFSPSQSRADFAAVMERVATVIKEVEPHDSVERYQGLGVECIQGRARFVSPWELEVDGRRLSSRHIVIATGARPLVPKLPGLEQVPYLTSDSLWQLREPPRHLLVLGGGPIGCELAQSFALLGVPITLVELSDQLLPREEREVAALLAEVQHLDASERESVILAALLHDLGKVNLPAHIGEPGAALRAADMQRYHSHVGLSVELAQNMALPSDVLIAIAQHHEMADGSGYPLHLVADDISRWGQILALVNRYDRLCNPLHGDQALTPHEAVAKLFAQLRGSFDASVLGAFIRLMGVYPPGSLVQLVDGRIATG